MPDARCYDVGVKMASDPVLARVVQDAAWRLTALRAVQIGSRVAVWMTAALLAVSAASLVVPVSPVYPWRAAAAAVIAATVAAGIVTLAHRMPPLSAARVLDRTLHLEERTSTAVELVSSPQALSALGPRVIADAAAHVRQIDLRQTIPVRPPRLVVWIPGLIAVLAAWPMIITGVTVPGTPAHRVQQAIRREGARLDRFARQLQARARVERLPMTRRAAPEVRDLGVRLHQNRLDRADALSQIGDLSRQLDAARRKIDQRLEDAGRPQASVALPSDLLRRQTVQQQIRQLQELTSRLRHDRSVSKETLERIGAITQEGEGTNPAQVREQLQRAQRQLQAGDAAGASESLTQALRMLENLEGLQADREGLESARQELERSRAAIASAAPGPPRDEQGNSSADQAQQAVGPGQRPVDLQVGTDSTPPPPGPHEGSAPGVGRVDEKLGSASPRLQAQPTPRRIRGAQSEGETGTSEILGAGRPGTARTRPEAVAVTVLARVDRALERARIPAQYRLIVLRYFQQLAQLK